MANVLSTVNPANEDDINSEQKFSKDPDEQLCILKNIVIKL